MAKNNRKVKVYQVRSEHFDKQGNFIKRDQRVPKVFCIGTVILPKREKPMSEESIWDLFNWTCWGWGKLRGKAWILGIRKGIRRNGYRMFPNHNAQGFCNSDIFMRINGKWMVAEHCGFNEVESYDEAVKRAMENSRF